MDPSELSPNQPRRIRTCGGGFRSDKCGINTYMGRLTGGADPDDQHPSRGFRTYLRTRESRTP